MRKIALVLPVLAVFLSLVGGAYALTGEQGGLATGGITTESRDGMLTCYSNTTIFQVWCHASSPSELNFLIRIPDDQAVGNYPISILLDQVYNGTNGTYSMDNGQYITTLTLNVTEPAEPEEPEENETDAEGTIKISLIGIATRGKMATVRTVDEKTNKAIITTVTITDPEGNAQVVETNSPTKGFGQFTIAEDSDVPVTIIAFADGYESGVYLINELKGEKLTDEEEETEPPKLSIGGVSGEFLVNNQLNGTVSADGELVDDALITITNPENSKLTAHSDSDGVFKVFVDKTGTWTMVASKDDYENSAEASITSRIPREDLTIEMYRGSQTITHAYLGEIVSFAIYRIGDGNATIVRDAIGGTISFKSHDEEIKFSDGVSWDFQMPDTEGTVTINLEQSENYNAASRTFRVVFGFDWMTYAIIALVVVIFIIVLIVILRRRGSREYSGSDETETEDVELME